MENNYYLYRHIRLDKNEPFYIGIGCKENYKRAYDKSSRNKFWNYVANKTKYDVEIIFDYLDFEEACKKEIEFIALYGRANLGLGPLVNLTDGGDGAKSLLVSQETRDKISLANKGLKRTEETKQKMSLAFKGRQYSKESINKRKEKMVNYRHSEDTKEKIKNSAIGRKYIKTQKMQVNLDNLKILQKRIDNLPKGDNHKMSKLMTEDVMKIKVFFKEDIPNKEIYLLFPNVSQRAIRLIKEGKNWKHIKI